MLTVSQQQRCYLLGEVPNRLHGSSALRTTIALISENQSGIWLKASVVRVSFWISLKNTLYNSSLLLVCSVYMKARYGLEERAPYLQRRPRSSGGWQATWKDMMGDAFPASSSSSSTTLDGVVWSPHSHGAHGGVTQVNCNRRVSQKIPSAKEH